MSADVTSANVVGYHSTALAADTYYMVAAQFDSVVGGGEGMALKDLVTGDVPYGAEMQVLRPDGGYDIYRYIEEAYDGDADDFVPGWGDGVDNLAVNPVEPGTAFWLKAPSAATVTIAGAVLGDASKTVEIAAAQYSMIANPYPVSVNPNALTWTGLSYGDELQVLKADGGYDIYRYIEEAYDGDADDFVPGWGNGVDELVTTGVIPVGQGAWIKPASQLTLRWGSPLE